MGWGNGRGDRQTGTERQGERNMGGGGGVGGREGGKRETEGGEKEIESGWGGRIEKHKQITYFNA